MTRTGCEGEALRRLAEMPFLDRLELATLTGRSRGAVYAAMDRLQRRGMVDAIPHASPLIAPTSPLPSHRRGPASDWPTTKVSPSTNSSTARPVSARWRRLLLERLDALAVFYRAAAALSEAAHPIRFRWYGAGPADAGIFLPDGRCLAVVRQGNTADRATFAKRLWRLSEEARPGAVLLLAPDEIRLRQASRALDSLPLLGFLAPGRGCGPRRGQFPGLADALRPRPAEPAGSPGLRASRWGTARRDAASPRIPSRKPGPGLRTETLSQTCLLPSLLKPVEKRALDLMSDWPWLQPAHLGRVDGGWTHQAIPGIWNGSGSWSLVIAADAEGHRCLALSDRGLAALARRDRTAVGLARQRWSAAPVKPEVAVDLAQRPRLPQPPVAAQPGPHPGRSLVPVNVGQPSLGNQGWEAVVQLRPAPGGRPASSVTTTASTRCAPTPSAS